jgi:hypothetical protein
MRSVNCAATGFLLAAGMLINSIASVADPTPLNSNPAAACASAGGTYLEDLKCQMPNGEIVPILSGADAVIARNSSVQIVSNSPHAWALATTAILFQFNGKQQDLLGGEIATPDARASGLKILSQWW